MRFNSNQLLFLILFILLNANVHHILYINKPNADDIVIHSNYTSIDLKKSIIGLYAASNQFSVWKLPLWNKIGFILSSLQMFAEFIKITPFTIGKIKDPFGNKNQEKIYLYIKERYGSRVSDISKNLKINRSTVNYHIFQLVSKRMIVIKKIGKYTQIFPISFGDNELENIIINHFKNDITKEIIRYIFIYPNITNNELSIMLKLDKSTIYWYIHKLQKDGIVDLNLSSKYKSYYIKPNARSIIIYYIPELIIS